MKVTTPILCILLLIMGNSFFAIAQNQMLKQANDLFERFEYANAIDLYQQILKKDKNNAEALEKLAECYRLTSNYRKAEPAYKKAAKYNPDKPILQFRYAQALMSNTRYAEAATIFEKYTELVPYDSRGWQFALSCKNVGKLMLDSGQYNIKLLPINSKESDFSPAYLNDGIVFASSRSLSAFERKDGWTGEAFLDLYYTEKIKDEEWTEPVVLPGKSNTPAHEGPATFNKFGTIMYFTRSATKGESKKSGTVNLKLYQAKWINGKWTDVDGLPFNSDNYSVGHPSLSPDGKTLYFTSDMPGGYGGKDLYQSEFRNGQWGEPQNLGRSINSEGDEMFPTIQSDGTLYYSSDGLGGLGGLDIFVAVNKNGAWIVDNAAYPINSPMDDFGLILRPDKQLGFFSSNRTGSRKDDIYRVTINSKKAEQILSNQSNAQPTQEPVEESNSNKVNLNQPTIPENNNVYIESKPIEYLPDPANNINTNNVPWVAGNATPDSAAVQNASFILIGHVLESISNKPLEGQRIELKDLMNNKTQQAFADNAGRFTFSLEPAKNYVVYILNDNGQREDEKQVSTVNKDPSEYIQVLLKLKVTTNVTGQAVSSGPGSGTILYPNDEAEVKPSTDPINPATVYTFKVQFGAFEGNPNKYFLQRLPYDSSTELTPYGDATRYMSREFSNYSDAFNYRAELIAKGYKGSFVVVYINGARQEGDVQEIMKGRAANW